MAEEKTPKKPARKRTTKKKKRTTARKKVNDMTPKQRLLVDAMVTEPDISVAEASRKAGYSSPQCAYNALKSENLREKLLQVMEEKGITDSKLANVMREGLEANKYVNKQVGVNRYELEAVPDQTARHNFLKTVLQVRGHVSGGASQDTDQGSSAPRPQLTLNFMNMSAEELAQHVVNAASKRNGG